MSESESSHLSSEEQTPIEVAYRVAREAIERLQRVRYITDDLRDQIARSATALRMVAPAALGHARGRLATTRILPQLSALAWKPTPAGPVPGEFPASALDATLALLDRLTRQRVDAHEFIAVSANPEHIAALAEGLRIEEREIGASLRPKDSPSLDTKPQDHPEGPAPSEQGLPDYVRDALRVRSFGMPTDDARKLLGISKSRLTAWAKGETPRRWPKELSLEVLRRLLEHNDGARGAFRYIEARIDALRRILAKA